MNDHSNKNKTLEDKTLEDKTLEDKTEEENNNSFAFFKEPESPLPSSSYMDHEQKMAEGPIYRFQTHLDKDHLPKSTRHDLQLGRRLFHFSTGALVATFYNLLLNHKQVVYILGTCACLLYVMEQIRIAYPELSKHIMIINKLLLRAEEQLKESSAIPYAMALLLTILTFPKVIALIAIYTLAVADPMSAIIGINFGKHKITHNKSLEGSLAFFFSSFLCAFLVLITSFDFMTESALKASFFIGFIGMIFEMIPIRIDDNLTIPLFTAFNAWFFCLLFGIPLS